MRIGIIGSGNVGGALGKCFARNGHTVIFGSREPGSQKMRDLLAETGPNARAEEIREVVRESELVVLSTPWNGTQEALSLAGDLSGKIVVDTTNPVSPDLSSLTIGNTSSAGELVAQWAKGAKVVKAFNTVGSNVMEDSKFLEGKVVMFYCGDDESAKKTVAGLIAELGFQPQDAGPLKQARLLEAFALLWITLALKQGLGRNIAFQFLKR